MSLIDKINKAKDLGRQAFKRGATAVPALDIELSNLLHGLPVDDDTAQILQAWLDGWHAANLADEGN